MDNKRRKKIAENKQQAEKISSRMVKGVEVLRRATDRYKAKSVNEEQVTFQSDIFKNFIKNTK